MKILVTGGAGFIGSHLCAELVRLGYHVTAFDNLTLGRREFIEPLLANKEFQFIEEDLLHMGSIQKSMKGMDLVFHLAANSDISQGPDKTDVDLKLGTLATYNVLESMRREKVSQIVFASTSAIYGEAEIKPTKENYGPLFPISYYGASKLACEGLLSSFSHNCGLRVWIFRFANIVGSQSTHGAIYDFVGRLIEDGSRLKVLGNGTQRKSYLHVSDCVGGMLFGWKTSRRDFQCFNLASEGVTQVRDIASQVVVQVSPGAEIEFGKEDRGWAGDVPFTWLCPEEMKKIGWTARLNSDEAVKEAVREVKNERVPK